MKLCIASGKGGTGKTTLAVNLARLTGSTLVDCDVEEPNSHLYFPAGSDTHISVTTEYPIIDVDRCDSCGDCARTCAFGALVVSKKARSVIKELCHACGACEMVCTKEAISWGQRETGLIYDRTQIEGQTLTWGILNTGEHSGVDIIKKLKNHADDITSGMNQIVDAPPGTGCHAAHALDECDYAVLVTEPTLFGLHDMQLAIGMLRTMNIPFGVFINKDSTNVTIIDEYCADEGITIVGRLPFSVAFATSGADGRLLCDESPDARQAMISMLEAIKHETGNLLEVLP
jgi:MinD superfamily P-loop ATPase